MKTAPVSALASYSLDGVKGGDKGGDGHGGGGGGGSGNEGGAEQEDGFVEKPVRSSLTEHTLQEIWEEKRASVAEGTMVQNHHHDHVNRRQSTPAIIGSAGAPSPMNAKTDAATSLAD